jgi:peroxiredoxin
LSAIREAADRFHLESPKLGSLALALTIDTGPKTRAFLEKLERAHPDKTAQGQAAMALALLSRELGDGGAVANFKKRRMELVRKAVIESANEKVGETTVGEIAENFLFAISHLDKGMEAPDLLGRDVSGEVMRLSDYRGQPVMLVFWHAGMAQAQETANFIEKVEKLLSPKGLVVLGVARESPESLRRMVKDGDVTWKNWVDEDGKMARLYQVDRYPATWILDGKGIVQYNGVPGAFAELTAQALLE